MNANDLLRLDAAVETDRIVARIHDIVLRQLSRTGVVIGVSGGIDSAVVAFLCARALGKQRVLALFTPETESSPDALHLGRMVAQALGVRSATEDITTILRAAQCYRRRDETVRKVVPEFLDGPLHHNGGALFSLVSLSILLAFLCVLRKMERSRSAI